MSSKKSTNKQFREESVEAKHHGGSGEPTTFKNEAKTLANDAVKSMWSDMLAGTAGGFGEQLLGGIDTGELHEGQEVSLKNKVHAEIQDAEKKVQVTAEHMEYFRTVNNADRIAETKTETQVKSAVDQIRMEIRRLIATSKIVEQTVKDATTDQAPVKPGKYHVTFFEFVLTVIRDATRKLEDTATYGAIFTSKKQQSKYWNSYKKHGTTFGLSGERSTATQTG